MTSGRIMGIDFGVKRTGLAKTDPEQIIATPLATVQTKDLCSFLGTYLGAEHVTCFVMGMPKALSGAETDATRPALELAQTLRTKFQKPIYWVDERFTSQEARRSLVYSGVPKKKRAEKSLIDQTAAVLILQSYLLTQK